MDELFEIGDFDFDYNNNESNIEIANDISFSNASSTNYQIIFVLDASNSMKGYKIGAVNDLVNNLISKLNSFNSSGIDISISVIGFSSKLIRWTNGFVPIREFSFSYIEMVDGLSDISAALEEILRLTGEFKEESKKTICLFSDGLPTSDYRSYMERLKKTPNFAQVQKICVSFDDDLKDEQSIEFFNSIVDSSQEIISVNQQELILSKILE